MAETKDTGSVGATATDPQTATMAEAPPQAMAADTPKEKDTSTPVSEESKDNEGKEQGKDTAMAVTNDEDKANKEGSKKGAASKDQEQGKEKEKDDAGAKKDHALKDKVAEGKEDNDNDKASSGSAKVASVKDKDVPASEIAAEDVKGKHTTATIPNPTDAPAVAPLAKARDVCCCNWANCTELQHQLNVRDLRRGIVILSNVTGAFQKSICRHLGVELESSPQRFVIAKHHWPLALLEDNAVKKRRFTSPLTLLEACQLLHIVDKKDSYKHPQTHDMVYCQAPNVPLHVVEQACWSDDAEQETEAAKVLANRNEIIERLLKENAKLKTNANKSRETTNALTKQVRKLEKIKSLASSPHWISTNTLLEFLNNHYGGLTRYTIQSDEWHANNPNAAKELFGYPTWAITKEKIAERFPQLTEKGPIVTPPRMFQSKKGVLQLDDVSEFEKCLCVKLMDRTGLTKTRAALLFGRQDRTVTYWRQAWCPQWGIARDGLEQSKHKAHLNQSTRKTPRKNSSTGTNTTTNKKASKKRKSPTPDEQETTMEEHNNNLAAAVVNENQPPPDPPTGVVLAAAALDPAQFPAITQLQQQQQQQTHQANTGYHQTNNNNAAVVQTNNINHNLAGLANQFGLQQAAGYNQQTQQQNLMQATWQTGNATTQQHQNQTQAPAPAFHVVAAAAAAQQHPFHSYQQFLQQHQQQATAHQPVQQANHPPQQTTGGYGYQDQAMAAATATNANAAAAANANKQRRTMYHPYAQL